MKKHSGQSGNTWRRVLAKRFFSAALFLGLFTPAAGSQTRSSANAKPRAIAVRAGSLFDGKSDSLLHDQVILVEGDRIAALGPAAQVRIPAGAEIVDLSHATLLPGLVDGHTHVFVNGPDLGHQLLHQSWQYRTLEALKNARRDLCAGFTTLRDLGTLGAMYGDVDLRNAIQNGMFVGPRMQVSGRALQSTGGFQPETFSPEIFVTSMLETVDSPWEARKAVREQLSRGTDWVKLYATDRFTFTPDGKLDVPPTFTLEEVKAIVDEAHAKGHKVACHAYGGPGLENCINAGVDTLEHGVDLTDADIAQLKAKGIYLEPTLYHLQLLRAENRKRYDGHSLADLSERSFRRAVAAGVTISFGTGVGPFPHGTQAKEFEYMVRFGLSPAQALRAATSAAARMMGWSNRIGSIEPGKLADLVAVGGNPLSEIQAIEHVEFVMKGGRIVRDDAQPERQSFACSE